MEKTLQERIDQKALRIQALYRFKEALLHRIAVLDSEESELLSKYTFEEFQNRDISVYNRLQEVTAQPHRSSLRPYSRPRFERPPRLGRVQYPRPRQTDVL